MLMVYLGAKGASYQSLEQYVSDPFSVQLSRIAPPTSEEIKTKIIKDDRLFGSALLMLGGKSRTKKVSRNEFRRKYGV
jgi:hypothetical protein